jgi:hypothetical protein
VNLDAPHSVNLGHLFVFPKATWDGFTLYSGQSSTPTTRQELDAIAARISERL